VSKKIEKGSTLVVLGATFTVVIGAETGSVSIRR